MKAFNKSVVKTAINQNTLGEDQMNIQQNYLMSQVENNNSMVPLSADVFNEALLEHLRLLQKELEGLYLKNLKLENVGTYNHELSEKTNNPDLSLEKDLVAIKSHIKAIEESSSWKLTAGMRYLANKIRRKKNVNSSNEAFRSKIDEFNFYQRRLQLMEASTSWRLTRWYRGAGDAIKIIYSIFSIRKLNNDLKNARSRIAEQRDILRFEKELNHNLKIKINNLEKQKKEIVNKFELKVSNLEKQEKELVKRFDLKLSTYDLNLSYKTRQIDGLKVRLDKTSQRYDRVCSDLFKISEHGKVLSNSVDSVYSQLESLTWLQRRLQIRGSLPNLRGWAASADTLLALHSYITSKKPSVVVELGSGASSVVIADALRQNNNGRLVVFEHLEKYANETKQLLASEDLSEWVDFRVAGLCKWHGEHINSSTERSSVWYDHKQIEDIGAIDLLFVDGPPGSACPYSRYPAVPALFNQFADYIEIWMDDTNREDEREICTIWAQKYHLKLEKHAFDKGLIRMSKTTQRSTCLV